MFGNAQRLLLVLEAPQGEDWEIVSEEALDQVRHVCEEHRRHQLAEKFQQEPLNWKGTRKEKG